MIIKVHIDPTHICTLHNRQDQVIQPFATLHSQLRDLKEETGLGWNQNWPWLKTNLTSDPNTSLYVQNALGKIHEASFETNLTPVTLSCTECTRHYLWSLGWNESTVRCTPFVVAHTECTGHNPLTPLVGWNYSQYFQWLKQTTNSQGHSGLIKPLWPTADENWSNHTPFQVRLLLAASIQSGFSLTSANMDGGIFIFVCPLLISQ